MGTENVITLRIAAEDAFSSTLEKAELGFALLGKEVLAELSKIHGAFQTLNLKSALDIDVEKARMLEAFNQIKFSGVSSADDIKRAQVAYHAELEKLDQQLKKTTASTDNMSHSMHEAHGSMDMMKGMLGAMAFSALIMELQQLAGETFESTIKLQALEVQFKTVFGSSELAAQNLRFVREESNRLGLVFIDTADAFAKFAASAKGTSLEGEGVRRVFAGVTEAVAAMHLPAESSQRIFAQLSQMMSKNKITAEDLNVVAESLPGTYTAVAQSLNLTNVEMRQQMESGKLLASDVLPKLSEQLHLTYGAAAVEGAKSAQAQFNRFKNSMVDVGVTLGQSVMPALLLLADVLSGVGATIKYVIELLGPGAPVAVAFAAGIGTLSLAWKVLTAEVIASTAAFLVNPIFLLVAAGTAAVLGVAAAIEAIADALNLTEKASKKSANAKAEDLKASQDKAAKEKKILDDYEAAVGVSLERQLAKQAAKYDKDVLAVFAKYDAERDAANGNTATIADIERRKSADLQKIAIEDTLARQQIREKAAEDEKKFYAESLKRAIEYGNATGNITLVEFSEYKQALQKKLAAIDAHYQLEQDKAKGNATALIAIESAWEAAILRAKEQASKDAILIGFNRAQRELESTKASLDSEVKLIEVQEARKEITSAQAERKILALEIDYSRQKYENRLQYYNTVVEQYGKESEVGKKAFKDLEGAHKDYLDKSLDNYKKYSAQIKQIDQEIKDFHLSVQERMRDASQKTMTSAQKYADDQKRFQEAISKSNEALAAKDMVTAQKYFSQADALSQRLLDKKVDTSSKLEQLEKEHAAKILEIQNQSGGGEKKTEEDRKQSAIAKEQLAYEEKKAEIAKEDAATAEGVTNTKRALNELEKLNLGIKEAQKAEAQANLDKLKEINSQTLADKSLRVVMDNAALTRVNEMIAELTKTSVKTIVLRYVKKTGSSGETSFTDVPGMATGGPVGGSGTGDTQLRLLDPREHVIRPEATAFWGDGLLSAFNAPWSAAGRMISERLAGLSEPSFFIPSLPPSFAMASGGPVGTLSPLDMGSLTINVGNGSYQVQGKVDVLSELKAALRREQLMGSNEI